MAWPWPWPATAESTSPPRAVVTAVGATAAAGATAATTDFTAGGAATAGEALGAAADPTVEAPWGPRSGAVAAVGGFSVAPVGAVGCGRGDVTTVTAGKVFAAEAAEDAVAEEESERLLFVVVTVRVVVVVEVAVADVDDATALCGVVTGVLRR